MTISLLTTIVLGVLLGVGTLRPLSAAVHQAQPVGTIVAGQLELARLVDLAASRSGVSVLYDSAALKAVVTLRLDGAIEERELWDFMNKALAERGLTSIRSDRVEDRKEMGVPSPVSSPEVAEEQPEDSQTPESGLAKSRSSSATYSIVRLQDASALAIPIGRRMAVTANDTRVADAAVQQASGSGGGKGEVSREGSDAAMSEPIFANDPAEFIRTRRLVPAELEDGSPPPGFASIVVRVRHASIREAVDAATRVLSKPGGSVVALTINRGADSWRGAEDAVPDTGQRGGKSETIGSGLVHDPAEQDDGRIATSRRDGGQSAGGLILISDLTSRLERALEMLAVIDVPGAQTRIEEVTAHYLPAQQLATLAMQVAAKRDAVWAGSAGGGVGSGGLGGGGGVAERTPGEVLAAPDGTTLLIVSPRDRVDWWRSLIQRLDKRESVFVATYAARHFAARDVAALIEQTVREGGVALGPSAGASTRTDSGAGSSGKDDRWRLVIDELTGTLIVTATAVQHAAITELIARLDSTPSAARRPVRTFVIKNRSVNEVRSILESLVRAGALDVSSDSTRASEGGAVPRLDGDRSGETGPGVSDLLQLPPPPRSDPILSGADVISSDRASGSSVSGQRGGVVGRSGISAGSGRGLLSGSAGTDLVFAVDEGTNTLIAVGEPRLLGQIEALLPTIDVRQPQVMLEVLLVTLSEAQTLDLGIELEQLIVSGDLRIRLSSLFGLGMRGGDGDRVGPDNANGFTGVVLSPGDFSVVVRALQSLNNGRSVSMPKLLVGNNQSATINSVLQQPFASVNASNTVSTTSFGGTQDAGTVVTVTPQIAEGDHLVMDYSVSLSSFVGSSSSATLPPPRQQNQVRSVATIPDGYTVVVGGIELETDSKSVSQIPIIGDIPVIGEAFKTRSKSGTRSKFYVFIRANVLRGRGFEDLKFLSMRDAEAAKIEDGFPQVRARIIR